MEHFLYVQFALSPKRVDNLSKEVVNTIIIPILQLRSTERLSNFLKVTKTASGESTFIPLFTIY